MRLSTIAMALGLLFAAAACRPNREPDPAPVAVDPQPQKFEQAKVDRVDPLTIMSESARSAILKAFPGARIDDAYRNKTGLPVRFTITLHHDDDDYEVVVSQKGKILEVSKEIDLADAPAAVRAAVAKRYPSGRINEVYHVKEYTNAGVVESISFEIRVGNADREVTFDLSGRFISEELAK